MKPLDKNTGSAVFVGQVASKPRVYWRNLTDTQVFLCLAYERALGRDSHTIPVRGKLSAVPVHGFELPGTFESAKFEKYWRHTMQTTNVADAVNDCAYVLSFLDAAFSTISNNRDQITLTHDERTGVGLILNGISQRLFASAEALSNQQTTLEV